MASLYLTAELLAHCLFAIADTQNRDARFKDLLRRSRTANIRCRVRTTRQNNRPWLNALKRICRRLEWNDFRIDPGLTYAACNKLRNLTAKVNDQNSIGVCRAHAQHLDKKRPKCNGRSATPPYSTMLLFSEPENSQFI